jgi:hypothetical protein
MANYTLKYIQCFWEKDYNDNKDKLPEHRVLPMKETLPYIETSWINEKGKEVGVKKTICIEILRPFNKIIDELSLKFLNEFMVRVVEENPFPIVRFKILDENNNVIYPKEELKDE